MHLCEFSSLSGACIDLMNERERVRGHDGVKKILCQQQYKRMQRFFWRQSLLVGVSRSIAILHSSIKPHKSHSTLWRIAYNHSTVLPNNINKACVVAHGAVLMEGPVRNSFSRNGEQ